MFPPRRGNVLMTKLPILPNNRTQNDRFDCGGKARGMAKIEDAGARQRLFADYAQSSRFFWAAVCVDPKWRQSPWATSNSATVAGALLTWSASTAASAPHRCQPG